MSHTETKEVTYLNGHRIAVGGKVYAQERECRDFGGEEGTNGEGYDFACSRCGFCCDQPQPNYCPNCGAKVAEGTLPLRTCRFFVSSYDDDERGIWESECGGRFEFSCGTPAENWDFCPKCGGKVVEE